MRSGELDRRITLRRRVLTENTFGEQVESRANVATVWAKKKDLRGTERFAAQQVLAEAETVFRIRYRRLVTPVDDVLCEGRVYDLLGVVEIGRRQGLELYCKARAE